MTLLLLSKNIRNIFLVVLGMAMMNSNARNLLANGDFVAAPFACSLVITNPAAVCSPATVNLTLPAVTVGSAPGTLSYWTNAAATTLLPNPTAISTSGTYYIKTTDGTGCFDIKPVVVTVNVPASGTPQLFPVCTESTTSSIKFDFNNMNQTGFTGSYHVGAGPEIPIPYFTAPTNYTINGLAPGQIVTMTLNWVGTCATKTAAAQVAILPTFSLPSALCVGTVLPTTSDNGIPGTWSPTSIITVPGGTDNYVFTPVNYNNCLPIKIVHIDDLIPTVTTFNTITPSFCQNSPAAFPTNTNSPQITGTWSPAVINTATVGTSNYTFTPNPALFPCATTKQITVTITPRITPTFSAIAPLCQNAAAPTLPASSTNTPPIIGTWNAAISTAAAGTTIYTFTPTAGQCTSTTLTTMSVMVNPTQTPNFAAIPSICSGSVAPVLSNTSPNGITGTWSPATISNTTTQNYTFTPTAGQCAVQQVLNVVVTPQVHPNFSATLTLCSATAAPVLATTSPNGITGIWSPTTINNISSGSYVFTPTAGQCASIHTLAVTITPVIVPSFATTATYCQGATALALSNTSPNGITGTWSPTSINTTTLGNTNYIFTSTAGQCASATHTLAVTVNPIQTPDFGPIASICSGGAVPTLSNASPNGITGTWSPATINNTTTRNYTFTPAPGQCAVQQVLNVVINPIIHPNFNPTLTLCSATPAPVLATTSPNGINGTWSPTTIDNLVSGTYVFTPTAGQCASTHTLCVTITPVIVPSFATTMALCQNQIPPTLSNTSPNGVTGTWSPSSIDTSVLGTFNFTFTSTVGQCASVTHPLQVTVSANQTPDFAPIAPFCEEGVAPVLLNTAPNGVTGTWSPSIVSNTNSGAYIFTADPEQCSSNQTLNVTIIQKTVPAFTPIAAFCAGDTAPVLSLVSNNGITGTWLPATVDNTVSADYFFTPDPPQCAETKTFHITVNQPVDPDFPDLAICAGATPPLLGPLSPNGISGSWMPVVIDNNTNASYVFTPNISECANPQTINVTVNQLTLHNVTWTVSNYFSDNQTITVLATDPGNYLYQLDYGPIQESNVFDHVSLGSHFVTVSDANGCSPSIVEQNVMVIGYPPYFTPNADSFNDTWNIFALSGQTNATIFIFDRYGKLLKQIMPNGLGWDGTYDGRPMPSTDYWFTVKYSENGKPKEFASHFSLKR